MILSRWVSFTQVARFSSESDELFRRHSEFRGLSSTTSTCRLRSGPCCLKSKSSQEEEVRHFPSPFFFNFPLSLLVLTENIIKFAWAVGECSRIVDFGIRDTVGGEEDMEHNGILHVLSAYSSQFWGFVHGFRDTPPKASWSSDPSESPSFPMYVLPS